MFSGVGWKEICALYFMRLLSNTISIYSYTCSKYDLWKINIMKYCVFYIEFIFSVHLLVWVIKIVSLTFTNVKLKFNSIRNQDILNFIPCISMKKWFAYKTTIKIIITNKFYLFQTIKTTLRKFEKSRKVETWAKHTFQR